MRSQKIEIMAPAGSFECLAAAIKAGADSVYFGVEQLNMRAKSAVNFRLAELPQVVKICRDNKVKAYLTLNTILYNHDLPVMRRIIDSAKQTGVNAIIASDLAAIQYAHSIGQEIHISTQLNVTNIEAVKFFSQFADVIVLARELNLPQINEICRQIKQLKIRGPKKQLVRIEIFVHGALCVSIAGKCYMSLAQYNSSANRGACLQACRRAYRVIDEETGDELKIENKYVMSPKDLCTIGIIDKILASGVRVLKIEGRGRSADYVYTVVEAYRQAADSCLAGNYTAAKINKWIKQLQTVFNRGFWQGGYYLGEKLGEWSGSYGSQAVKQKILIGRVVHYYPKVKRTVVKVESGELNLGDQIIITGSTTGLVSSRIRSLYVNDRSAKRAVKGQEAIFHVPEAVRKNDKILIIKDKNNEQFSCSRLNMPKVIHYRENCLGCGACAALYPQYFEMNPEDGKAMMKGAKEKNRVYVLDISPEQVEDFSAMAKNCPANIFKIVDP